MHYYQHNISDYRADTGHLTLLEHGCYHQLLDQYYLNEEPLPLDIDKIFRLLTARTQDEKDAIKNKMRRAHSYMNGYEGNDVIGYDEVTVLFGTKKDLEKQIKEIKDVYYNVKQEMALKPEIEKHWGGLVNEL